MDTAEAIEATVSKLKLAQAEKSKRLEIAVKEVQENRHKQTGEQPRLE